jgi:hypothetical protein
MPRAGPDGKIGGMTDFDVRPVTEDERRTTLDLLGRSLHTNRISDESWAQYGDSWPAAHKFGAFDGGTPIGIVSSFDSGIAVPGGAVLPLGAVDGVGVRADRTRRGVLTAMMAVQLGDFAARGIPLAALHASEPTSTAGSGTARPRSARPCGCPGPRLGSTNASRRPATSGC